MQLAINLGVFAIINEGKGEEGRGGPRGGRRGRRGGGDVKMLKDDAPVVIQASSGWEQMPPDSRGGLPRAFEILFAHCVQPENIIEG